MSAGTVKQRKMDKAMMHILIYVILSAAYLLLSVEFWGQLT